MLYSKVILDESYKNDLDLIKGARGLQVVDVDGVPTCKSVVDGSDPNCVPVNVFGAFGISDAAYGYIFTPTFTHGVQTEKVLNISVNGDLAAYGIADPERRRSHRGRVRRGTPHGRPELRSRCGRAAERHERKRRHLRRERGVRRNRRAAGERQAGYQDRCRSTPVTGIRTTASRDRKASRRAPTSSSCNTSRSIR